MPALDTPQTPALAQNNRQHVISKMPQVLTVGSESLAAGFATRNNSARAPECNRRLPFDERAPNVPFKFGLGFPQNFCFIHVSQGFIDTLVYTSL